MAEISASLVKALRDKTNAGMMDCKKALIETAGDLEAAVDWLRKKGLSAAAKRSGRVASEGLIGVAVAERRGVIVEVNSETDFVARNEIFRDFVAKLASLALDIDGGFEGLKAAAWPASGRTIAEEITHLAATIGENITLRRADWVSVGQGIVASYIHSAQGPGIGRIGVLVALEGSACRRAGARCRQEAGDARGGRQSAGHFAPGPAVGCARSRAGRPDRTGARLPASLKRSSRRWSKAG